PFSSGLIGPRRPCNSRHEDAKLGHYQPFPCSAATTPSDLVLPCQKRRQPGTIRADRSIGGLMNQGEPRDLDPLPVSLEAARPAYSEDGVDLTLIRWMLSLTPGERLRVLQQHVRAIQKLRHENPHL